MDTQIANPVGTEQELWNGHPTLWKWTWLFILGVILAPVLIGLFILLYIFMVRNSTKYTVTNKRVSFETGIFTKTSRELRIQDIRSIAARVNFLGYGDIEFSSSATDDADVTFIAVPDAASVRDLVKKLQS